MRLLVTGGCGFIGSHFVRRALREPSVEVVNLDRVTYAGNLANLEDVATHPRYRHVRGDVAETEEVATLVASARISAIVHLAAESHVDRSLQSPLDFVRTNVCGTAAILEAARRAGGVRVLNMSSDEVCGPLSPEAPPIREDAPVLPMNPYSATKAAADHLGRAYFRTFGLPVVTVRCTNNYGPYQHPEKFIPLAVTRFLRDQPAPLYGDGLHVRDWIYVEDHVEALWALLDRGRPGEIYHVGARNERRNRDVLVALVGFLGGGADRIQAVPDRPGHDRRYATDPSRIEREIGWRPRVTFEEGLARTVEWYRAHAGWWEPIVRRPP